MGKKLPYTPNSRIRAALRQLWLRSRERAIALKEAKYTCAECGIKQSKVKGKETKVEVHHRDNIRWEGVFDFIRERILQDKSKLQVLCKECHKKHTMKEGK